MRARNCKAQSDGATCCCPTQGRYEMQSCSHRISVISTEKELLFSSGLSADRLRSIKASMYGTVADAAGTNRPHAPSRATEQVMRSTVDLPAIFGPANPGEGHRSGWEVDGEGWR